jgi:hypothetical protein
VNRVLCWAGGISYMTGFTVVFWAPGRPAMVQALAAVVLGIIGVCLFVTGVAG